MEGECFNCAGRGTGEYTIVLESGQILRNKRLCDTCAAAFRDSEWVAVHEGSVVVRGENDE